MTEGCHGGYAIFQGFLAENGEIVSEDCAPYAGDKGSCKKYSSCKGRARIKKSYALKNPSILSIQKEILYNGAVDTNWVSQPVFGGYTKGIITGDKVFAQGSK